MYCHNSWHSTSEHISIFMLIHLKLLFEMEMTPYKRLNYEKELDFGDCQG